MKFYTNFHQHRNETLVKGKDQNGNDVFTRFQLKPKVYIPTEACNTGMTTVNRKPVMVKEFKDVYSAKAFINERLEDKLPVFAMDTWEIQAIYELFPEKLNWIPQSVKTFSFDIEVQSDGSFPHANEAKFPITMITIRGFNSKTFCFTVTDFEHDTTDSDIGYFDVAVIKCKTEEELLYKFVKTIQFIKPDVLIGWNSEAFDIPYIVNRLKRIESGHYIHLNDLIPIYPRGSNERINNEFYRNLSPWGLVIKKEKVNKFKKKFDTYQIVGIQHLDYMLVYKKFTYKTKVSYSLDAICHDEIKARKIKYKSSSINQFFIDDPIAYTKYNIRDSDLIFQLDLKKRYINIVMILAYMSKCNYEDTLGTIKPWDALLYGMLLKRNMVVPVRVNKDKVPYPGAYVKLPTKGKYKWVLGLDFNSLYPHIFMMWNIGMETLVPFDELPDEIKQTLTGVTSIVVPKNYATSWDDDDDDGTDSKERPYIEGLEKLLHKTVDLSILKKYGLTMAANNSFYRTDSKSIFSEKVEEIYALRKATKRRMNDLEAHLESNKKKMTDDEIDKMEIEIQMLDGEQMAYKIFMNSLYGATASPFFRWFENEIASATTCCAQLSIRWVEMKINTLMQKAIGIDAYESVIYVDTDSTEASTLIDVNGKQVTIGEYYDSLDDVFLTFDDENREYVKKVIETHKTKSFDELTECVVDNNIEYVKKHYVNKRMFRITAEDGKEIILTENHGIIVYRDGEYKTVKPSECLPDDLLISIDVT